jgi:hypothetical protein
VSLNRFDAKNDANQPAILKALKEACISAEVIRKPLDLLLWSKAFCPHCRGALPDGKTELMEVKMPDGDLNKNQVEFIARWPGRVHVARSPEEAVALVLGAEAMK